MYMESWGFGAEKLDEIGRMAGGWHKAALQKPKQTERTPAP
jgi:hypothetical protein